MKVKVVLIILASLLLHGCSKARNSYAIFEYEDFGPQVMAWEEIGMQWWQWDNHGDDDPKSKYDIKVVVYAGMPLDEIKSDFRLTRIRSRTIAI